MTKTERFTLLRILISAAIFAMASFLLLRGLYSFFAFLVSYLIVGGGVVKEAFLNILHGQVFDENFLMTVATIGAFALGEFPEAVAVMLFYQVGEVLQAIAVNHSRASIADLMDIRPQYANLMENGTLIRTEPEKVSVGTLIYVKPGERIPLDGMVMEGTSALDTAALTGESMPREVTAGDSVVSGCINLSGMLAVRVSKEFEDSTVAKILELVESASEKKSKSENFITKFARWYTPAVVFSALALAFLPPLWMGGWQTWIYRALTFLVISCPCALVLSVPLSFFCGIGGASKCGILIKGSNYIEALSQAGIVVFDKTGTLTEGVFQVTDVHPTDRGRSDLLELAALVESVSNHPISRSLLRAWNAPLDLARVSDVKEVPGCGLSATVDKTHSVAVGNHSMMRQIGITVPDRGVRQETLIHVAVDGRYAGWIVISDQIRTDSRQAVEELRRIGIRKTVLLTGDTKVVADRISASLGLDESHSDLLPSDKVSDVEALLAEKREQETLIYMGDGVNDAPVLARADVGVAMGGLGSDAALEAADVVIMTDEPSKLVTAVLLARKTMSIVRQNLIFAISVKGLVLALGGLGLVNLWAAVFADVGVSILAVLNALRVLKVTSWRKRR